MNFLVDLGVRHVCTGLACFVSKSSICRSGLVLTLLVGDTVLAHTIVVDSEMWP
jgi:hypothetical protein